MRFNPLSTTMIHLYKGNTYKDKIKTITTMVINKIWSTNCWGWFFIRFSLPPEFEMSRLEMKSLCSLLYSIKRYNTVYSRNKDTVIGFSSNFWTTNLPFVRSQSTTNSKSIVFFSAQTEIFCMLMLKISKSRKIFVATDSYMDSVAWTKVTLPHCHCGVDATVRLTSIYNHVSGNQNFRFTRTETTYILTGRYGNKNKKSHYWVIGLRDRPRTRAPPFSSE